MAKLGDVMYKIQRTPNQNLWWYTWTTSRFFILTHLQRLGRLHKSMSRTFFWRGIPRKLGILMDVMRMCRSMQIVVWDTLPSQTLSLPFSRRNPGPLHSPTSFLVVHLESAVFPFISVIMIWPKRTQNSMSLCICSVDMYSPIHVIVFRWRWSKEENARPVEGCSPTGISFTSTSSTCITRDFVGSVTTKKEGHWDCVGMLRGSIQG